MKKVFVLALLLILIQACICSTCLYRVHRIQVIQIVDTTLKKPRVKLTTNYGSFEVYGTIHGWVERGSSIEIFYKNGIATYIITKNNKRFVIL